MEIAGHEEMQATDVCQINVSQLKNICGNKSDQINDQQIFGDGWYAEHHIMLALYLFLFFALIFQIPLQNY